jgi:hypothetical protein
MDIPCTTFSVFYDKSLFLCEGNNYFRVSSLYPEFEVLDQKLNKIIGQSVYDKSHTKNRNSISYQMVKNEEVKSVVSYNIHHQEVENDNNKLLKSIKNQNFDTETDSKDKYMINKYENDNNKLPKSIKNQNFDTETDSKDKYMINKYESDKHSYSLIKNDIEKGLIKEEEIHPDFTVKYQIFKILELKGMVDLNSNNNIIEEYKKFDDIYQITLLEDVYSTISEEDKINDIYIPHNYHYLTDDEKEEYAKKYQMTKQQLEDRYLSSTDLKVRGKGNV